MSRLEKGKKNHSLSPGKSLKARPWSSVVETVFAVVADPVCCVVSRVKDKFIEIPK